MEASYDETLSHMEISHRVLASCVTPPDIVQRGRSLVYRYAERSIHQARVQKLAQRMLDEFNDDVTFLAHAA